MLKVLLLLALAASSAPVLADVKAVMAEPDLEKRSQLAIQHAMKELDSARTAYSEDKMDDFKRLVTEIGDLAEISYKSLQDTGKKARRSPKWFKRAELSMRTLLRHIDGLEKDVSIEDRELVDATQKRVESVHQQLLHDIMTKK